MANVPLSSLPKLYSEMDNEIPKSFKRAFGSKRLTRFMTFVDHYEITNADYDAIVAETHRRLPSETDEELRLRSNFRKDLEKFKHHFYVYETPLTIPSPENTL